MLQKPGKIGMLCVIAWALSVSGLEAQKVSVSRDDLSEKDVKRVNNVTRFATDFVTAEQFEVMSGGGATSTA
ncbi:MAG: hypothetical protein V7740_17990, partial [Pseudomonas marincola]